MRPKKLIDHDFPSLADEIAEPRPDMNIKVAALTVSEKLSNIDHLNADDLLVQLVDDKRCLSFWIGLKFDVVKLIEQKWLRFSIQLYSFIACASLKHT